MSFAAKLPTVHPKERAILFSGAMVRAILAGQKTQTRRVISAPKATVRGEVRADLADLMPQFRGTVALPGKALRADFNPQGAVSVVAKDGRLLGVKPGEFDFVCPYAAGRTYLDGGWRIDVQAGSRLWVRSWEERCDDGTGSEHGYDTPCRPHCAQTYVAFAATPRAGYRPRPDKASITYLDESTPLEAYHESLSGPWRPSIFMPRWASRITLEVTEVRVQRVREISEDDAIAEGIKTENLPPDSDNFHPPGSYGYVSGTSADGLIWPKPVQAYRELWDSINAKRGYSWESNPWCWAITFRRLA